MKYRTLKAYLEALGYSASVDDAENIVFNKPIKVERNKHYPTPMIYTYDVSICARFENNVIGDDEPVTVEYISFNELEFMSSREIRNLIDISRDIEYLLSEAGVVFDEHYPFIDHIINDSEVDR